MANEAMQRKLENFLDGSLADPDLRLEATTQVALANIEKTQAFFAALALEASRPHCSDAQKDLMKALLLQAETVGIYKPVTP